jgi:hypothetical protein
MDKCCLKAGDATVAAALALVHTSRTVSTDRLSSPAVTLA